MSSHAMTLLRKLVCSVGPKSEGYRRTTAKASGYLKLFLASTTKMNALARQVLSRFNKIAIQGTPQMAADKEAIGLLRVCHRAYYSVLIRSVSRLYEILVYSVLEHINTTSLYTIS